MITKIISGGQTGADQAGLFVAHKLGISTGGWAPTGWTTKEGPNPTLLRDKYGLKELLGGYRARTIKNIEESDGTIVLSVNWASRGTALTVNQVHNRDLPLLKIDLIEPLEASETIEWLLKNQIKTLNVAGNAEMSGQDIFDSVCDYLTKVLEKEF